MATMTEVVQEHELEIQRIKDWKDGDESGVPGAAVRLSEVEIDVEALKHDAVLKSELKQASEDIVTRVTDVIKDGREAVKIWIPVIAAAVGASLGAAFSSLVAWINKG